MPKRSSINKGGDLNTIAARVVSEATGSATQTTPLPDKNPAAVALGRLGGLKGGKARAEALSPKRRKEIASKAASSRWKRKLK